jgi:hypothetical protein
MRLLVRLQREMNVKRREEAEKKALIDELMIVHKHLTAGTLPVFMGAAPAAPSSPQLAGLRPILFGNDPETTRFRELFRTAIQDFLKIQVPQILAVPLDQQTTQANGQVETKLKSILKKTPKN